MPIIIDNFFVNNPNPIDNRFVVGTSSFYSNKDLIQYKYTGLRIWDLNDGTPYVWTGTTWLSENSVGVTVDNTSSLGYIPKFKGTTLLGNSIIYETGTGAGNVGIGLASSSILPNISGVTSQIKGLHVSGNIKTDNRFIGNGLYITDINASNITTGNLTINRISPLFNNGGSTNTSQLYVLQNTGNNIEWVLSSGLSVGSSTNSDNIAITNDDTTDATHYINFTQGYTGYKILKASSNKLQFKPNNGQLLLSNGNTSEPVYSFINSTNSGIHYNASIDSIQNVLISVANNEITRFNNNGVLITKGRLYIPLSVNNTNAGNGIIFNDDTTMNDGFIYEQRKLNNYGIGSHVPTLTTLQNGRGIYISGYFGVDIFTGGRLKLKVHEQNDVTINSRFNINNDDILGGSIGNNVVLSTMKNPGGSSNSVVIKDWSVRGNSGTDWLTWKHHNGITVDGVYNTPNGTDNGLVSTSGTLTFWERYPAIHEQYFGSVDRKTLTINSGLTSPFVKVSGNLLVGTSTILPSVIADFTSTNKGILPPRLTTTQRGTINTPVEGLTIYNTTTKHMEVYDGTDWIGLSTTKVDYGSLATLLPTQGQLSDLTTGRLKNYNFIYPPTGYTISNLVGFIASIEYIDFEGDVDNNDTLWCRYAIELANTTYNSTSTPRIRVWCNNSENNTGSGSRFTYMAIYQK